MSWLELIVMITAGAIDLGARLEGPLPPEAAAHGGQLATDSVEKSNFQFV